MSNRNAMTDAVAAVENFLHWLKNPLASEANLRTQRMKAVEAMKAWGSEVPTHGGQRYRLGPNDAIEPVDSGPPRG